MKGFPGNAFHSVPLTDSTTALFHRYICNCFDLFMFRLTELIKSYFRVVDIVA